MLIVLAPEHKEHLSFLTSLDLEGLFLARNLSIFESNLLSLSLFTALSCLMHFLFPTRHEKNRDGVLRIFFVDLGASVALQRRNYRSLFQWLGSSRVSPLISFKMGSTQIYTRALRVWLFFNHEVHHQLPTHTPLP